jgi:glycosyltransferase involved in cell wall biosynthesis
VGAGCGDDGGGVRSVSMKICFMSNLYPPFVLGGAEISVKILAEGLVKKGHEVFVITTSPSRKRSEETINGVKIYRIKPFNLYPMYTHQDQPAWRKPVWHVIDLWNPSAYFLVKRILKKEMPDIVHINNYKGLSLSVFSSVKRLHLPLIFTAHDFSLLCPRANLLHDSGEICTRPSRWCTLYSRIQKWLLHNNPNLVTAPSRFVLDMLQANGLFESVEIVKLPNAIEIKYKSAEKNYSTLDVLFVGSLSRHKGVHVLIAAFTALDTENIRLHIVGKGKDEMEFKNLAGSDNRIVFHGFVPDEELMELYQTANVTVIPSIWYDNSPMVIYESLMHGTPVIGSRIGGIPELVEEGYNGYLFEAGNMAGLRALLETLILNQGALKRLEDGALGSVKRYDIEKLVDELETIYRRTT